MKKIISVILMICICMSATEVGKLHIRKTADKIVGIPHGLSVTRTV